MGGAKDLKPEKLGRKPLEDGGLCKRRILAGGAFRQGGKQAEKHIPATQAVVLNEGEVGCRSQSLVSGKMGVFNDLWDKPEGLEEVTGGVPWPVGAGWGPLGGAGASLDWWRGLGVERSIVRAGGALGEEGAGRQSSPTSMGSTLLEEVSDSSSSEGAEASG